MTPAPKHPENDRLLNFKSGIEGVLWPPLAVGAKAALVALLRQMEETQWLPREKIADLQFAQMGALAQHAARYSPNFRERLQKAGLTPADLVTAQGLKRLPPLTRRDIQDAGSALYCTEVPKSHLPLKEVRTSGSTGEPVVVRKTALSDLVWMAMALRDHFWHGRDFSGRLTAIRSSITKQEEHPSWGMPVDLLFDSGPTLLIPITTDIREQIRLLREFRPQHLIVYPSNLAGIIDECQKQGTPLTGIQRITTISETLNPEFRHRAEEFFNLKIQDVYSSSEMGNVALQCPVSGLYHIMAENIILEVLDNDGRECAEGQTGKVVVTDLLNFATPLIRYSINDYAEVGGPCPCGRGLPTIKRFLGRERNLILHPDGTRFRPAVGLIKFHDVIPVNQFQFIQHDLENVEVRLVTESKVTAAEEDKLRAMIDACLGHVYKISFVYFEQKLPLPPSMKFEDFICKV
jgi:phenylacetate-CoA ligase